MPNTRITLPALERCGCAFNRSLGSRHRIRPFLEPSVTSTVEPTQTPLEPKRRAGSDESLDLLCC